MVSRFWLTFYNEPSSRTIAAPQTGACINYAFLKGDICLPCELGAGNSASARASPHSVQGSCRPYGKQPDI